MRSILRKLHIVQAQSDDAAGSPAQAAQPPPSKHRGVGGGASPPWSDQKLPAGLSSWLDSAAVRHADPPASISPSTSADGERREEMDSWPSRLREQPEMDEEEYQIQMALELSAREDPEAAQIEAVKQFSLGCCATENTPAEVLAYRYWNYNALCYDDKILDGFYDLYGILGDSTLAKMPSLVELQATPVSEDISWEAVLVNRAEDADLLEVEQKALLMALDLKSEAPDFAANDIVQSLAILVANHMGGAISDPVRMLRSWRKLTAYMRASTGNLVLPLGRLTVGLARHRALLFKVLADSLSIPCQLIKGLQYTGSEDEALNIVKLKDGREYIVDLMADPGTLILSYGGGLARYCGEAFSANSGVSSSTGCSESESVEKSFMSGYADTSDKGRATSRESRNQEVQKLNALKSSTMEFTTAEVNSLDYRTICNSGMGKAQEPSCNPNLPIARSPSWSEAVDSPAVHMMKVKDISEYMINATKENPELAQKLHDVLLESGVVVPPDLFTEICKEEPEAMAKSSMYVYGEMDDVSKRGVKDKIPADRSHGSILPHLPTHNIQRKVIPSSSQIDPLKPAEGLGFHHPLIVRQASKVLSPFQSEASTSQLQDSPVQLLKHMPVAAAAATAAVVASSMVVAAAKSSADMNMDVPFAAAATATAAAVVATTAVSRQYEHFESCASAPVPPCSNDTARKHEVVLNNFPIGSDHGQDGGLVLEQHGCESHQETERTSNKSTETESAKSDVSLEDVAELEIPWEEIVVGERIGLGSYGEVYHGDWHGTEVAVKKFLQQDISSDALEEFINEVRLMKKLRHPNVVLLMGAVTRVPNLSIITEFLPRGSLFRLIHRPNNQLDERRRFRMALDVARGMNYLHTCTPIIVHRDLKSPNLLVDKNWVVKVCDFGLSRMKHNTFLSSRSTAGTAEWMAPEVLRNEPSDEKCDVFSFGVILWELCTLQQPWRGMNPMQVVGAVGFQHRRLDMPNDMDPVISDIIKKCWYTDPKMRPSFSEIMSALKPMQKANIQIRRQRAG